MTSTTKKIAGVIRVVLLITVMGALLTVNAEAKTKKTKTVTPEEQTVIDLTKYIEALGLTGADQATIDAANQALAQAKAAVETQALQEAQLEAYEAELKKQQAEYEKALKKASKNSKFSPDNFPFIFVGDSRTVQMHEAVGDTGVCFVAENGKGYNWFSEKAIPQVDAHVGKGTKILINLGVNDPGNADKYVALVNQKAAEWNAKGAKVYYATVFPVTENPYTSEEQVKAFNQKIVSGLQGVNIIDTYTWLKSTGFRMVDGLHFSGDTTINIYSYLIQSLM